MIRRLLVLASVALLGCKSTVESGQQLAQWTALDIKSYTYTYSVGCFCGFNGPNPARITVRNGEVVSVTSTDAIPHLRDGSSLLCYALLRPAARSEPGIRDDHS